MKVLSNSEVKEKLKEINGWKLKGNRIEKVYRFKQYMDGIAFVNKLAELAEKEEHHPDIEIIYTTVTVALTTHDAGGITNYDIRMAKKIIQLS